MTTVAFIRHRVVRKLALLLTVIAILAAAVWIAFQASPWPSVWQIRREFGRDGVQGNAALSRFVPPGIRTQSAIQYDPNDAHALLDIYRPAALAHQALPVVFWIHGGGYVAGHRTDLANYARILAADGYTVVAVDYPLAPEVRYPAPIIALNRALAFLSSHAVSLQLDRRRFVLAGDSAGAQLAAQLALVISSSSYAASMNIQPAIARVQVVGTVLYCGPFDAREIVAEASSSRLARTFVWSYFGSLQPSTMTLNTFTIAPNVTSDFPATFINVGNIDALAPQSYVLANALQAKGVQRETLFYPATHVPPLDHEYQFDLGTPDADDLLKRTRAFLGRVTVSKGD